MYINNYLTQYFWMFNFFFDNYDYNAYSIHNLFVSNWKNVC